MSKCRHFQPHQVGCLVNCRNCKRWSGTRCKDKKQLLELYEETEEFKTYDRMMRENKGVRGPL